MTKRPAEDERPAPPDDNIVAEALDIGRLAVRYFGLEQLRRDRATYFCWLPAELIHVMVAPYLSDARIAPGRVSRPTDPAYVSRICHYTPRCTHIALCTPSGRYCYKRHLIMPNGTHVVPRTDGICTFRRIGGRWKSFCLRGPNCQLADAIGVTAGWRFTSGTLHDVDTWFIGDKLTTSSVPNHSLVPINVCYGTFSRRVGRRLSCYTYVCDFPCGGHALVWHRDKDGVGRYRCRIVTGTNETVVKQCIEAVGDVHGIVHDASRNVCIVSRLLLDEGIAFAWLDGKTLAPIKKLTYKFTGGPSFKMVKQVIKSVTVDHKGRISLLDVDLSLVTLE